MLKTIIIAAVVGIAVLIGLRRSREWLLEEVKALTDLLLLRLLVDSKGRNCQRRKRRSWRSR